ncbi:phosphoribosylformylglycinamidine synthase [bacterium]|jgi:phosphoribosylformylglycinamidine synthase|nr:phosphoribosylformylglycinamidine synthase [bacterium]
MLKLYTVTGYDTETCYYVELSSDLSFEERETLLELLAPGLETYMISEYSIYDISESKGVEIGPLMNFETAFSTNVVSACVNTGIEKVRRVEKSTRYLTDDISAIVAENCDRMTQEVYEKPLDSFYLDKVVEDVQIIPLIEEGIEAFDSVKGLSFSKQDKRIYYDIFVNQEERNPTNVELFDLLNSNCEHSRHGFFNAKQKIDGVEQKYTAFDLLKNTLKANPDGSVIGFHDNSSSIEGYEVNTLVPYFPGESSSFFLNRVLWDITFTAETHNFPTGIAPYPGAATGTGGRLRDQIATGKGSNVIAGTTGYSVSTINIPDYKMPGENSEFHYPVNMAGGLQILVDASNAASDYGNEFGEPVVQGYCRNFDLRISDGERWGYVKPILFSGGIGQMRHVHAEKGHAETDLIIVQVGGPAYRIGFGGGAASSMHQGDNDAELDFNAVQRGNAEMENKVYRVIRACNEMGNETPIVSIHDQGAGGPANVLKELVEESGGKVDIRKINSGDPTMSVLELWVCEYQERCGFLISSERIDEFKEICEREKAPCEILGEVTGDGRFVVEDSENDTTPVDFNLKAILEDFPQSTYSDDRVDLNLPDLEIPSDLSVPDALQEVFKLLAVGSKGFLVHKVDRSVGGLVTQQQCVGPLQLPLSNAAVVAISHFGMVGAVTTQGENPTAMIIDPEAGACLAVAEMLLNMMSVLITSNREIKCSVNWMWAPKKPGEGTALYDAVTAMTDFMPLLNVAIDGGKDSLSMATDVDGELIKSPRTVVVSGYAPVPDIRNVITPDIKKPKESSLFFIDLSMGKARLGGSAFAQSLGQLGNETPDINSPEDLLELFHIIQSMISNDQILAYHDISDGGLITTLCEMAMGGNCGIHVDIKVEEGVLPLEKLFAEEKGVVIEVSEAYLKEVSEILANSHLTYQNIGSPTSVKHLTIRTNNKEIFHVSLTNVYEWWSETSYKMEKQQGNICVANERFNTLNLLNPEYKISFVPEPTLKEVFDSENRVKVAVIREEGSNGDKEMISALTLAGLNPFDITMTDLLSERENLNDYRGAVFVGGFSYADYPESAKAWAMTIRNHPELQSMFDTFKEREDTWSYGVCNGCQMVALLGWTCDSSVAENKRPRFVKNKSSKFESRYTTVKIPKSNSIMFKNMTGSILPVWSNHAEGHVFADKSLLAKMKSEGNIPVLYANNAGDETQTYPFNPNGSPMAIAGFCSSDGRHTIMMPHPERLFQTWQFPWLPEEMQNMKASPWLKIFQNARDWCEQN